MAPPKNPQALIARLMNEEMGMTSPLSGMMSQGAMAAPEAEASVVEIRADDGDLEEPEGYSGDELRLTKRFVELVGGVERARELVDKVDDCEDCLQLIDDDQAEARDVDQIGKLAELMPSLPDLPTGSRSMNMSSLYNPNAGGGGYS